MISLTGWDAIPVGFIHETALILYVYLPGSWNEEESCLTVSCLLSFFYTRVLVKR